MQLQSTVILLYYSHSQDQFEKLEVKVNGKAKKVEVMIAGLSS